MSDSEITRLEPPDSHRVHAAEGWLGLGLPGDARAELDEVSKPNREHPETLRVKWEVLAALHQWDDAYQTALLLIQNSARDPAGWIHRAYAARRMTEGSLEKAFKALYPAVELFPDEPLVPYNLACYCCQMNRLPESRIWLQRALRIPRNPKGKVAIKNIALADKDLEAMWDEIRLL